MTNRRFDAAILDLARRQHGVFNQSQITAVGGSSTMVQDRISAARWIRLAPSVYALSGFPPTWQRQFKAAELSAVGGALRGTSAALIHGLEGARVLRPQLVVPYRSKTRSAIADLHRSIDAPTVIVDGFRVTTVAQTLFDLLAAWRLDHVERAMDGALLTRRLTVAQLAAHAESLQGSRRPNLAIHRELVAVRTDEGWAPPESELEAKGWPLLQAVPDAGFVRQGSLPWWRPGEGRVDAVSHAWRLIVEFDGRRWHARVADFDRDRWRDADAVAHGYRVMRFSFTHVMRRPVEVAELVAAAGAWRLAAAG